MNRQDFLKEMTEISDLMAKEKYKEALTHLEKLKEIEKDGDFDYDLIHKLYQLDSNTRSLYNQEIILSKINASATKQSSISISELNELIKPDLQINEGTLRKEIELLILRDKVQIQIDGNELKF
jgi:hypothetical protein